MTNDTLDLKYLFGFVKGQKRLPELDLGPLINVVAAQAASSIDSEAVGDALTDALVQALTVNLGDVLSKSWSNVGLVKSALDATKKDPKAVSIVPLAEHKIVTNFVPKIEVMADLLPTINLSFTIDLNMLIKGAKVEVKKGNISGILAGEFKVEGVLKFSGLTIKKIATPSMKLPGRLSAQTEVANQDLPPMKSPVEQSTVKAA